VAYFGTKHLFGVVNYGKNCGDSFFRYVIIQTYPFRITFHTRFAVNLPL
jgi:hypothetical protein